MTSSFIMNVPPSPEISLADEKLSQSDLNNPCNSTPSLSPSSWTLLHLSIRNFGIAFFQFPHLERQWESCLTKCHPRAAVIDFIFPKALHSNEYL